MYQVFLAKIVAKEGKKRGKNYKRKIAEVLQNLSINPHPSQSERLTGELDFVWSFHFTFSGTAYRLAYLINEKEKAITVIMVGPRENFYKTLKQKIG